jgi:hypothetical protein
MAALMNWGLAPTTEQIFNVLVLDLVSGFLALAAAADFIP